jgi:hypothetical protein
MEGGRGGKDESGFTNPLMFMCGMRKRNNNSNDEDDDVVILFFLFFHQVF